LAPSGREGDRRVPPSDGGWLEPALRDEKIQKQYERDSRLGPDEGLTMREPGEPPRTLWANASHEQMNEVITQDANPATVAETSEEWVAVGDDLGTHQKTLGDAVDASTSNWQGGAGDAVREHLAGVGQWLGATAQGATLAGRQQEIHSQALNETQRQMAANPPVQFDLPSTNRKLMAMTDPVQYAAAAGEAVQTYRAQTAARDHAAQILTQYDETIGGAAATPRFPAPPKLPSAVATATQAGTAGGTRPLTAWSTGGSSADGSAASFDGLGGGAGAGSGSSASFDGLGGGAAGGTRPLAAWSTGGSSADASAASFDGLGGGAAGGTRPLAAWSAGESPAAFDGVSGGTRPLTAWSAGGPSAAGSAAALDGLPGTAGAGAGPGFVGGGIPVAGRSEGALSTFDRQSRSGLPGSGIPATGDRSAAGDARFEGTGFSGAGGSGVGPSGFSGGGIPAGGTGTAPAFDAADLPRGSSFSGAGIPASSVPGLDGSTTSSGFTPSGIDGSGSGGGIGGGGGIGYAPMPLGIPDASGGGAVRGGGSFTGGGFAAPGIDPITGLPGGTGTGSGGSKLPVIGRGGGINGESIGSRLGDPGGAGGGGTGGSGASVRGAGNLSGGAVSGLAAEEAAAARGAMAGRGTTGAAGSPGMAPMGAGAKKDDDNEHKAASYLESGDPDFFSGEQVVAPPVIGDWTNPDWR
jgi:hypothetical protein